MFVKRKMFLVSLFVLVALAFAACQGNATTNEEQSPGAVTSGPGSTGAAPGGTAPVPQTGGEDVEASGSVTVQDQPVENGAVTVEEVVSSGPGWMVIHADDNGNPGPDIGHAAVQAGANANVVVEIDESMATEVLYAMLHVDVGEAGTYEFPGPDIPVIVDGVMVTPPFNVSGLTGANGAEEPPASPEPLYE